MNAVLKIQLAIREEVREKKVKGASDIRLLHHLHLNHYESLQKTIFQSFYCSFHKLLLLSFHQGSHT